MTGVTIITSFFVTDTVPVPIARTLNVYVAADVVEITPLNSPDVDKVTPGGKEPAVMLKVGVPVSPVAENCTEYPCLQYPAVKVPEGVIFGTACTMAAIAISAQIKIIFFMVVFF